MSVQTIASGPRAAARMSARSRDRLLNVVSPLALLLVWELCARFHFIDTRFFPAPSSVIGTLIDMLRTGELVTHTAISMQRLAYGTILGALPALILGIAMATRSPGSRRPTAPTTSKLPMWLPIRNAPRPVASCARIKSCPSIEMSNNSSRPLTRKTRS